MALAKGLLTGKYKSLNAFDRYDPRYKDLKLTKKIIDFSKKLKIYLQKSQSCGL